MKLTHDDTVVHVHVSYLPTPRHIGEPKTKPTQLSVKQLIAMSIQPDFLVARSESDLDDRRRERLALFCNLHKDDVIVNRDQKSIYEVPLAFYTQKFDSRVLAKLGLPEKKANLAEWQKLVKKTRASKKQALEVAIVGKYFATGDYNLTDSYHALIETLEHTALNLELDLKLNYINSLRVEKEGTSILAKADAIIVPIGWGARGTAGKIEAIRYAREHKVPYLGLCYGMQLASIEFARNVVGLKDADSTEISPSTKNPVIHDIPFDPKYQRIKGDGTSMRLG